MSKLTQIVVGTHEFKWHDKVYNVKPVDYKVKAEFERKQFARARDAVLLLKTFIPLDEYEKRLDRISDDFVRGEYALESTKGLEFAKSNKGVLMLCAMLFDVDEETMTHILMDSQTEVVSLVKTIIAESFGTTDDVDSSKKDDIKEDSILKKE
jgi:hypothetical protein